MNRGGPRWYLSLLSLAMVLASGADRPFAQEQPIRAPGYDVGGDSVTASEGRLARWYAEASPWNTPVAPDASIDPRSSAMVQTLVEAAADGFSIAVKRWSIPVYYADATTPRHRIPLTARWSPVPWVDGVPIPPDAAPDPAGDKHLMVIDQSSGCEYDLYDAVKLSDGSWSAGWANATSIHGDGWFPTALSATGSGAALGGGLITAAALDAGEIAHALGFVYALTKSGGPVLPATESDGKTDSPNAIPEGARLQLDPGIDLSLAGLTPYELVIARALQKYGMYLVDTGGGVSLRAQHPQSIGSTSPYAWGDRTYVELPRWLLEHMRVLTLSPQYRPRHEITATPCVTFDSRQLHVAGTGPRRSGGDRGTAR